MIDKEQIKCKYKFQDKEKFDGKPYCTCFNELCEDLTFVCDHNCQIYEDFKQLARKTQECEQKDKEINEFHLIIDRLLEASGYDKHISSAEDFEDVYKDMDYKLGLIDELKQECEELKRKLSNQEQLYQNEIEIYNQSCLQLRQENDDLYLERLALNTANSGINALLEVKEQECDRCRKALEEIEKYTKKYFCENCEDFNTPEYSSHCEFCEYQEYFDIINKAKGEGNE